MIKRGATPDVAPRLIMGSDREGGELSALKLILRNAVSDSHFEI